jgi:hypothetical protein
MERLRRPSIHSSSICIQLSDIHGERKLLILDIGYRYARTYYCTVVLYCTVLYCTGVLRTVASTPYRATLYQLLINGL